MQAFERVLFRATRGNVYLRSADITQQVMGEKGWVAWVGGGSGYSWWGGGG